MAQPNPPAAPRPGLPKEQDPSVKPDNPAAGGELHDEPKGVPTSDRHRSETAHAEPGAPGREKP